MGYQQESKLPLVALLARDQLQIAVVSYQTEEDWSLVRLPHHWNEALQTHSPGNLQTTLKTTENKKFHRIISQVLLLFPAVMTRIESTEVHNFSFIPLVPRRLSLWESWGHWDRTELSWRSMILWEVRIQSRPDKKEKQRTKKSKNYDNIKHTSYMVIPYPAPRV